MKKPASGLLKRVTSKEQGLTTRTHFSGTCFQGARIASSSLLRPQAVQLGAVGLWSAAGANVKPCSPEPTAGGAIVR
jgi:hypothetical protein